VHKVDQGAGSVAGQYAFSALTAQLDKFYGVSPYLEALWRPTPRILIRPGVRADTMSDGATTKSDIDPRLTLRYKLADRNLPEAPHGSDGSAIWLKGSAGIYHQPPRFVLPLPGLDMMPLKYGLLRSYQTSLGVEIPLEQRFQFNVEGFFNYMDPTIFDLQINDTNVITAPNSGLVPNSIVPPRNNMQMFIDRLTAPETGRAYGGEVLLRRESKTGVFGWVSYTLSRSERYRSEPYTDASGQGQTRMVWRPYDFDRTHLVNVVAGLPLRRNWDIGMRWQYQSGAPVPVTSGYNNARKDGYLRLDVRVDKRAVYRKWLLDFYVDITNIAVLPEEVQPGTVIRYVLPTVGLRGRLCSGDTMNNGNAIDSQVLDLMLRAGSHWVLYLLLALSVAAIAVMLERVWFFWSERRPGDVLDAALAALRDRGAVSALGKLSGVRSMEAAVARACLAGSADGVAAAEERKAAAIERERARYEQRLAFLGTLGNNAPFVGLFGTVLGIIRAFHDLAGSALQGTQAVMAGIAEALVATGIGLVVALPAVAMYNVLMRHVETAASRSEVLAHEILALLKGRPGAAVEPVRNGDGAREEA
jgi:biopolymer transport protein ExbB